MTFMLEAAVTRKVMKPEDRRFFNGNPRFRDKPCKDHNGRAFLPQRNGQSSGSFRNP